MASCIAATATPFVAGSRPVGRRIPRGAVFATNATIKKTTAFKVWSPINNKFFETFSYLPALSDEAISKQVDYIVQNGWTPCLEFADADVAYTSNDSCTRIKGTTALYYDNRYWTLWKLPMFGCTDGSQVLKEIAACRKAFPDAYSRLVAFDPTKQVQVTGFLVNRPAAVKDYQLVEKRSVA
eukprot:scaffold2.g7020.t1